MGVWVSTSSRGFHFHSLPQDRIPSLTIGGNPCKPAMSPDTRLQAPVTLTRSVKNRDPNNNFNMGKEKWGGGQEGRYELKNSHTLQWLLSAMLRKPFPSQTAPFVILLCLMADDFTRLLFVFRLAQTTLFVIFTLSNVR